MNSREKSRAQRILAMKLYLEQKASKGERVEYKELIAKIMLDKYCSYRTVREDVDALINSGLCGLEDGEIFMKQIKEFDIILSTVTEIKPKDI